MAHDTIKALNARIEAAENDAAHQKALADSALRVANGWERKCGELRAEVIYWKEQKEPGAAGWRALARILQAKIDAMEKQGPIKYERRIKRRNEHTWGHWRECYKTDYTKAKTTGGHYPRYSDDLFDYEMRPIYALPGAKGE